MLGRRSSAGTRRSSDGSQPSITFGSGPTGGGIDLGYSNLGGSAAGEEPFIVPSSSSSDVSSNYSDKESMLSWAQQQEEKEEKEDTKEEREQETRLKRWFLALTFAMVVVGVAMSVFTYYYLSNEEQQAFESTVRSWGWF